MLLSCHQPISSRGLDKLTVYIYLWLDAMTMMNVTSSSLGSSNLSFIDHFVRYNILPKRRHQDELRNNSLVSSSTAFKETSNFHVPLLIVRI